MGIKEIMLGDWLWFDQTLDQAAEIMYIQGKGVHVSFAASATLFPIHIDKVRPVALSPEIMERMGFERKKCDDIELWSLEEEPYLITFMSKNGCPCLTIEDVTDKDSEHNCLQLKDEVYNVHELQHALRLFGIDKPIIL